MTAHDVASCDWRCDVDIAHRLIRSEVCERCMTFVARTAAGKARTPQGAGAHLITARRCTAAVPWDISTRAGTRPTSAQHLVRKREMRRLAVVDPAAGSLAAGNGM